ncbi:MAG: CUB domain-containing protein, partial [bacterium]
MRRFLIFLFIANFGFAFIKQEGIQKEPYFSKAINPKEESLLSAKRFNEKYENKWRVEFNPSTGLIARIFGYHTEPKRGKPEEIALSFLSENKPLFKIEPKNIRLLKKEKRKKFAHVSYQQIYQGIIVENANIIVSLTNEGRIISMGSNYYPNIEPQLEVGISKEKAIEIAKESLNPTEVIQEEANLVILPKGDKGALCWKIRIFCKKPLGDWISYIDVKKGNIVERYNNLRFQTQGRVMGKVFPSIGKEQLFLVPFRHENVNIGTTCVFTDDEGYYHSPETGLILSELKGPYVDVDNEDKEDVVYTGGLNEVDFNLSSFHPYPNNYNGTWTITQEGAKRMTLHFSRFELEDNFDYLYIYNGSDTVIATYTGTKPPFWTNEIEGDAIKIRLQSDESGNKYGFDIDRYAFFTGTITPSWIWDYHPDDSSCDEVNVFYHINLVHDYYKNTLGFSNMDYQMKAIVRYGTNYDNAFYFPSEESIYFGEGGDYENFSRSSDVIYHEYTHGVVNHIYNLLP